MMKTTYDPEADVFYARFVRDGTAVARTLEVPPGAVVDLDAARQMVGNEVLIVRPHASGACVATLRAATEWRHTPPMQPPRSVGSWWVRQGLNL